MYLYIQGDRAGEGQRATGAGSAFRPATAGSLNAMEERTHTWDWQRRGRAQNSGWQQAAGV